MQFPDHKSEFILPGPAGNLEVLTTIPDDHNKTIVGIICHPHPLFEGTMHNKVVSTIARAFENLGAATVRFNFRGVGKSEGTYGRGVGEIEDLLAVLDWVQTVLPQSTIWLAGFSFGSFISASVANQMPDKIAKLLSIAPAVNHSNFQTLTNIQCPWLVIQGDQDEIVPFGEVKQFAEHPPSPLKFLVLEGVGHFFHGKLLELRELIEKNLK